MSQLDQEAQLSAHHHARYQEKVSFVFSMFLTIDINRPTICACEMLCREGAFKFKHLCREVMVITKYVYVSLYVEYVEKCHADLCLARD